MADYFPSRVAGAHAWRIEFQAQTAAVAALSSTVRWRM